MPDIHINACAIHCRPVKTHLLRGQTDILLFGKYFQETEKFTMEYAQRLWDRYGERFQIKIVKILSRKRVKVYNVKSSKGDKFYKVVDNGKNVFNCNCPGFIYRKKCRHVAEVKEMIKCKT